MDKHLQSRLRRSNALKEKAIELDVKEYVWCQRGSQNERIELISVLPTKHIDQVLCAFHTKLGEKSGWFTARLYLTKKATKAADLLSGWHHKIECKHGRVYGVKSEFEIYPFEELTSKLVKLGFPIDLMPRFGIVPQTS